MIYDEIILFPNQRAAREKQYEFDNAGQTGVRCLTYCLSGLRGRRAKRVTVVGHRHHLSERETHELFHYLNLVLVQGGILID